MMSDNRPENELKLRKGFETIDEETSAGDDDQALAEEDASLDDGSSTAVEVRSAWQTLKYYFNRFRYYHFVVADTIDKYLSAAMLWIINMYFKLFMGVGTEPPSILTEAE